ncbi:lipid A deacylase LpxR family protein [Flavobacterium sp. GT3R68]|uniref:lipid A deacylase LpxR family protein n=1 Tax=Flavobacterium sp. GT3R68 TaxID=2594437 RepID=UPI00351BDD69
MIGLPYFVGAQKNDNTASFRDLKAHRYVRFNYDNDYFASRDQDYTQGYNLELVSPGLRRNPMNKLLVRPKKSDNKFGISLEHLGYTPIDIKSASVQYGDRPFAAALMLKSFALAIDTVNTSRLSSLFSIGVIGPGALGKEVQVAFHKVIDNTIPEGWQNQIRNDVVLNYEVSYEKQLVRYRDLFSLQTNTTLRAGTLFTNAGIGATTTFGIINGPFSVIKTKKRFLLYGYSKSMLNVIGYDATLQGGLFNRTSPYTIENSDIERFTAQVNYGIVFQIKSLYLEYSRAVITREFEAGHSGKWGGVKVGLSY